MALEKGYSIDHVHSLTKIDKWFLSKLKVSQGNTHLSCLLSELVAYVTLPVAYPRFLWWQNISLMKAAASKASLDSLDARSIRALKVRKGAAPHLCLLKHVAADVAETTLSFVMSCPVSRVLRPPDRALRPLNRGEEAHALVSIVAATW